MKTVDGPAVRRARCDRRGIGGVPAVLSRTLTDIAAPCREGLTAVAVEAGLATAAAVTAEEVERLCGPWNARDPERSCERGGTTATSVVMGGQRPPIRRPRVHALDETGVRVGQVPLGSFSVFAQGDLLLTRALDALRELARLTTGRRRSGGILLAGPPGRLSR